MSIVVVVSRDNGGYMFKQIVIDTVTKYFPQVKIGYKDQSTLLKFLGILLFFNPSFMVSETTTIGDTIYYPNINYINVHPATSFIILMHELIHVKDAQKITKPFFSFLYMLPQILFLPALLLFLISWKIAVPVILLFLLPLPAYFRMVFEKRAYMASLYTMNKLNVKSNYNININDQKILFVQQFKNGTYYFAWLFSGVSDEFDVATQKILQGERPYDDPVFDILDEIISVF